jgi:hypothetical protein
MKMRDDESMKCSASWKVGPSGWNEAMAYNKQDIKTF